ncbi:MULTISPECIES: hypothetical protein [Cohnella]|uniref:Uncharacterized protein n=1 Tax=Cohnella hashimotonis TaxID=2826895 RepID=A0ABT6TA07_9BACL|nr:hypothetical protein [Cohnella hashimotonis]MDI4643661.1 hypothetical protein [Cohnella hashimotonis]
MSRHWIEDQKYLLAAIDKYRSQIEGENLIEQKKMTLRFAQNLHNETPELNHRTVHSINERLPYLDNLLAGVFEVHNYAAKDQHLYLTRPRMNGNRDFNACNTRHSYNGAVQR